MIFLRCVCTDRSLDEVLVEARKLGLSSAAAVADKLGCGGVCRSCRPYIARMLQIGRAPTVRDLMNPEEAARYSDEALGSA